MEGDQKVGGGNHQSQRCPGGNTNGTEPKNSNEPEKRHKDRQKDCAPHVKLRPPDAGSGLTRRTAENIRAVTDHKYLHEND